MGWCGYGRYSGDDTQTQHITFLRWAGIKVEEDTMYEWMHLGRTNIPHVHIETFKKGLPKVLAKMHSGKFWDEDKAIEWQMLMCLFLDNNIKMPKIVKQNGVLATEYLMGEHSNEFNMPSRRRAALRRLLNKASKK